MSRSPSNKSPNPTPRRRNRCLAALFSPLCLDSLEDRILFNTAPTALPAGGFPNPVFVRIPVSISYNTLLATSGATDADHDPIAFQVTNVNGQAGFLFLNHAGTITTALSKFVLPGDFLAWVPTRAGELRGFNVRAGDAQSSAANDTAIFFNTLQIPLVSIVTTQLQTWEAAPDNPKGVGLLTVSRTGDTSAPLDVTLKLTPSTNAKKNVNFQIYDANNLVITPNAGSLFTITIPAGASSTHLTIKAIQDNVVATSLEQVGVIVAPSQASPAAYAVSPASWNAGVNIIDSAPVISIKAAATNIPEGAAKQAAFIVTRTAAPGGNLANQTVVALNYSSSTFSLALHFSGPAGVLFAANQSQKTVFVTTTNDGIATASQSIAATISANNVTISGSKTATIPLIDPSPTVTIAAAATTIQEGTTATAFTLTRAAAVGQSIANTTTQVNLSYTGSTFAVGNIIAPTAILFAPGETTRSIVLQTLDDGVANGNQTITAAINGTQFLPGTAKSANITVADASTTVSISAITATASASTPGTAVTPGRVRITRSGGNTNIDLPVAFTTGVAAANGIRNVDYALANANNGVIMGNVVTIPAGATTLDILVIPINRPINKNSTAVITLVSTTINTSIGTANLYNVGTPASATVTINNTGAGLPTVFFGSASLNTTRNTPITIDFGQLVSLTGARVANGSAGTIQLRVSALAQGTLQVRVGGTAAPTAAAVNTTLSAGDILIWNPPVDTSFNGVLSFTLIAVDGTSVSASGTGFFITAL